MFTEDMVQLLHIIFKEKTMERKHPVNLFVRDCITISLFKLMEKKDYHKISISELVKLAGVSRNSFYRNYQSLEDIIRQYLNKKTTDWWVDFIADLNRYPYVIAEMFQLFLNIKKEINLLYKAGLSYILMEHIVACGKESLTGELSNAYQTAFMSEGLWGLTNEWVLRGVNYPSPKGNELVTAQSYGRLMPPTFNPNKHYA